MTEHSRFPPPGKRSLFERAEEAFGGGEFQPAPVPAELAAPANRPVRKAAPADATPLDIVLPSRQRRERSEDVADYSPALAPPVARPEPAPVPQPAHGAAPRLAFSGPQVVVDRARLRAQGLIDPDGAATTLLEEFRLVKRQLLLAVRAAGGSARAQRLLVCSPLPGEGKTFCAINLALAIAAERDSEVVLVDADFGKPSIPGVLGFTAEAGLMDALADGARPVEELVLATDVPGLFVLPAGGASAHDSEYLASARTREVLARLTQGAPDRIVIFDSPPALAASPASELAGHVGQALVVCRADQTGMSALEDALSLLAGCPDIKLLLNAANFSPSGRRFGTYYGYSA